MFKRERTNSILHRVGVNLLRIAVVGLTFYYIGRHFHGSWKELSKASFHVSWGYLSLSALFMLLFYGGMSGIWALLTRHTIPQVKPLYAMSTWGVSILGKYVPGKIIIPISRIYFYGDRNLTPEILSLYVVELLTLGASSLLLFNIGTEFYSVATVLPSWAHILISAAVLLAAHPRIVEKIFAFTARFRKEQEEKALKINAGYGYILLLILLQTLNLLVFGGLGYFLMIKSFFPDASFKLAPFVAMSMGIASVAAFLFLHIPAGLGVRDSLFLFYLKQVFPPHIALVATISARIWATLSELVIAALGYVYLKYARRSELKNASGKKYVSAQSTR